MRQGSRPLRHPAHFHELNGTYTLAESYEGRTLIKGHDVDTDYCALSPEGYLFLKKGYNWNGPSGPAVDTMNTSIPSALHDALYRLIQDGLLPRECRKNADRTYRDALKTWGVSWWRRKLHFKAVFRFGGIHMKLNKD